MFLIYFLDWLLIDIIWNILVWLLWGLLSLLRVILWFLLVYWLLIHERTIRDFLYWALWIIIGWYILVAITRWSKRYIIISIISLLLRLNKICW